MNLKEALDVLPFTYDIYEKLLQAYIDGVEALSVDFSADVVTGAAPLAVTFTAVTTGVVDTIVWDFGDGSKSNELTPTYSYTAAGDYSVVCIVQDELGIQAVSAKPDYITVT